LNSLPNGSLVLDVGCGNGKYLSVNPNIVILGCDRSQQLLKICRERNHEIFLSDCLQLSVRNQFDACICIAVLHHLSSLERRVKALQLIIDLLSINGTALIYVWAFEQQKDGKNSQYLKKNCDFCEINQNQIQTECDYNICIHQNGTQFQRQDLFVPWKTLNNDKIDQRLRYYHVFKEGELENLVNMLRNAKLLDIYYDRGNWCAIIQRI
jgi:alkylated DNA repair protein alkB family protein 8